MANSIEDISVDTKTGRVQVSSNNVGSGGKPLDFSGVTVSGVGGGGGGTFDIQVAQDTAAYSLVTITGLIANSSTTAHYGKVVGMATQFVANGQIAHLVDDAEVTNGAWAWSPGTKLFLNGTSISATPPSSGFSQMVAAARSATTIVVQFGPPLLL